ncbi:MAG: AAA family ATPase, partial [Patescibacteria group bacterium]|nr:AAA family ATPase [Patescibacteria group bacterium]
SWQQAGISKRIERIIVSDNEIKLSPKEERRIETRLKGKSAEQKVIMLYQNMRSYVLRGDRKSDQSDTFRERTRRLWEDKEVQRLFLERFADSWEEDKTYRLSGMRNEINNISKDLNEESGNFRMLSAKLNFGELDGPKYEDIKELREGSRELIEQFEDEREAIIDLSATETVVVDDKKVTRKKYEQVQENTDVAAMMMHEKFLEYQHQNEKKRFVWFPSKEADRDLALKYMEQGKAPLGIGPPGTGKTSIFEAVAEAETGVEASKSVVRIRCHPGMSEEGLIYTLEIGDGSTHRNYQGTATEVLTGLLNDKQTSVEDIKGMHTAARFALFDEVDKLNSNKAKAAINALLDNFTRVGEQWEGHPIIRGAMLAATANEPLTDEAIERRFARVPMDYFKMTEENPELYEFFIISLMQKGGHLPAIPESLLKPGYKDPVPVPLEEQSNPENILRDGSVKVKHEKKLIEERNDKEHGFLYRLAHAVRAIQDAYIHGSKFNEKHLAGTAMYFVTKDDGTLDIPDEGYQPHFKEGGGAGEGMLVLKSGFATLTAGTLNSWFKTFDAGGKVDFVSHIHDQLNLYIRQLPPEEQEKVKLVLNYFGIYDNQKKESKAVLTPKEIGYLSPRVPRPMYVEKQVGAVEPKTDESKPEAVTEAVKYENYNVVLEDGTTVNLEKRGFKLRNGMFDVETGTLIPLKIAIGRKFIVNNESFIFAGVAEDKTSPNHAQPVGKFAGEGGIHKVFILEELHRGLADEFESMAEKRFKKIQLLAQKFWKKNCVDNEKNNPNNIEAPAW